MGAAIMRHKGLPRLLLVLVVGESRSHGKSYIYIIPHTPISFHSYHLTLYPSTFSNINHQHQNVDVVSGHVELPADIVDVVSLENQCFQQQKPQQSTQTNHQNNHTVVDSSPSAVDVVPTGEKPHYLRRHQHHPHQALPHQKSISNRHKITHLNHPHHYQQQQHQPKKTEQQPTSSSCSSSSSYSSSNSSISKPLANIIIDSSEPTSAPLHSSNEEQQPHLIVNNSTTGGGGGGSNSSGPSNSSSTGRRAQLVSRGAEFLPQNIQRGVGGGGSGSLAGGGNKAVFPTSSHSRNR